MAQETRPKDYPKLKRYKPEKDSANMSCDAKVHFIFVLSLLPFNSYMVDKKFGSL